MVLGWRRPGRVGRCRIFLNNEERKLSSYKSHARQRRGKLILLSSVGSSERLLTARSLVRVQQGEPQKESKSYDLLFLLSLLLLGTATISIYGNWCANLCYKRSTNMVDVQTMFASIYYLVLRKTPYFIFLPKVLRRKFIHGPTGGG